MNFESGVSGNLCIAISDHLAQFLIIPKNVAKLKVKKDIYQRDIRFLNKDNLKKDLSEVNWHTLLAYERNDPNFSFDNFEKEVNKILDKHIPIKKLSKNEMKKNSKPWITQGIKKSIKRREKLYSKSIKSKT